MEGISFVVGVVMLTRESDRGLDGKDDNVYNTSSPNPYLTALAGALPRRDRGQNVAGDRGHHCAPYKPPTPQERGCGIRVL